MQRHHRQSVLTRQTIRNPEKRRKIAKLYRAGVPIDCLTERFQVGPGAVYRILDIEGEPFRGQPAMRHCATGAGI